MLQEMPNAFREFKCGEVFCLSNNEYKVKCCLCQDKLVFEAFPEHFLNNHLGQKGCPEKKDPTQKTEEKDPFKLLGVDLNNDCKANELREFVAKNEMQTQDCCEIHAMHDVATVEEHVAIKIDAAALNESDLDDVPLKQLLTKHRNKKSKTSQRKSARCLKLQDENLNLKAKFYDQQPNDVLIPLEIEDEAEVYVQQPNDVLIALEIEDGDDNFVPQVQADDESDFHNDVDYNITEQINNKLFENSKATLKTYKCSQCPQRVQGRRALFAHVKTDHGLRPRAKPKRNSRFKCDFKNCTEGFPNEKMLRNHRLKHESSTCDICGKSFSVVGYLAEHKRRHENKREVCCSLCDYKTFTEVELKSHMITHTGIVTHICEICGKKCRHKGQLNQHMRRHTGERPCKCDICDKSFFSAYDLKVHMPVHSDERPFVCHCGARAKTKRKLRVHQKIHETERNFECQLCDRKFAKENGLKYHIVVFHDAAVLKSVTSNNTNQWRKKKDVASSNSNVLQTTDAFRQFSNEPSSASAVNIKNKQFMTMMQELKQRQREFDGK